MRKYVITGLVLCGVTMLVAGCTKYYKVTDTSSGKTYYTTEVDKSMAGAIKIKDPKTGSTVTLQSSEVKKISEPEYYAGMAAPAAAAPQPAPVPTIIVVPASAQAPATPSAVPASAEAPATPSAEPASAQAPATPSAEPAPAPTQ